MSTECLQNNMTYVQDKLKQRFVQYIHIHIQRMYSFFMHIQRKEKKKKAEKEAFFFFLTS